MEILMMALSGLFFILGILFLTLGSSVAILGLIGLKSTMNSVLMKSYLSGFVLVLGVLIMVFGLIFMVLGVC